MDGILIIDKPAGITSHDVVAKLRKILKTRKIGHTGTLDPFATGVLVMLVGRATRLAQFLDNDDKEYDALVAFGYETDTGDRTGNRREKPADPEAKQITPDDLIRVISGFMGPIKQIPPMFSAKKIEGRKLYELARRGEEIARKPIEVMIFKLDLSQDRMPSTPEAGIWHLRFLVKCSAGTYIRTLAEDIGRELGPGAHLADLRRTAAGRFGIEKAITLDELGIMEDPASKLIPMAEAVVHLRDFRVEPNRVEKTLNGLSTRAEPGIFDNGELVRMTDKNGDLLGIGIFDASENAVKPTVVLGRVPQGE